MFRLFPAALGRVPLVARTWTALVLAALGLVHSACRVEPRPGTVLTTADAGLRRDASVADAGTSTVNTVCRPGSDVCGAGRYCSQDGVCVATGVPCDASGSCPIDSACLARACTQTTCTRGARPCAGNDHCSALGSCGPALAADGSGRTRCVEAVDCGLFAPDDLCRCAEPVLECVDGLCVASGPELE